jgi:hypothetical protein
VKKLREYLMLAYGGVLALLGAREVLDRIRVVGWLGIPGDHVLQIAALAGVFFGVSYHAAKQITTSRAAVLLLDVLEVVLLYLALQAVDLVPKVAPGAPGGFGWACAYVGLAMWLQLLWRRALRQPIRRSQVLPRIVASVLLLMAAWLQNDPVWRGLLVLAVVALVVWYDMHLRTAP